MTVKLRTERAMARRVRATILVEIDYGFCHYAPLVG